MFARFYPRKEMESAYAIPYGRYAQKGIRGVIFDIDNTLVMHGAPADERARELFCRLEGLGLKTCLLSNNKERRVKPFADAVGSPYIFKADKPSVKGYRKAMEAMGTYSILVKPIDPREEIQIVIKRRLEAVVLYFYHRREKEREGK